MDIASIIGKRGLALLWGFVESILKSISQALWDGMWAVVFDAVESAEEKWESGDYARKKKEFVIEQAIQFVENRQKLGWIKKQAVKLFLSTAIDHIINSLNSELGKNWVEKVKEKEDELDDYFAWIE